MTDTASKTKDKIAIREIDTKINLLEVFHHFHTYSKSFFLDSALGNQETGRYSFIGHSPFLTIMSKGSNILIQGRKGITKKKGNPLNELRNILSNFHPENNVEAVPFTCGAVGYFAYDLCHFVEKLPNTTIDDIGFPEMYFSFYDTVIGFDNLENKGYITSVNLSPHSKRSTEERLNNISRMINHEMNTPCDKEQRFNEKKTKRKIISNFSKEDYLKTIERAKHYIRAGDIYQVNLSQRFQTQTDMPPYEIYNRLRKINPAPFSCFLKFDNKYIISSSPERFLSVRNMPNGTGEHNETLTRKVQTRPIKGTRPRCDNEDTNLKMKKDLLSSKKDNAELTMIIDLERNDLGRVCNYNTVKVTEERTLEEHPSVYHLAGTIEGELHPRHDTIDLIKASFPGGSITGAPKVRAMQIIDELEPTKRSVYTGAIGYIGFNGNIDLNIAIRTFLVKDDHVYFQVGGGIVADSDPEEEYEETLHKAKALIDTIE